MKIPPAVVASLVSGGIVAMVGVVTWQVQASIARTRIWWEAEREAAQWEVARLEAVLTPLIEAGDAANRYVFASADIDVTEWHERKDFVLAILDPLGKARAELQATADFESKEVVGQALKALEQVAAHPASGSSWVRETWDADLVGQAIHGISIARNERMAAFIAMVKPRRFRIGWLKRRKHKRADAKS